MPRKIKTDVEACKLFDQVESVVLNDDDSVLIVFKNGGPSFSLVITDDYPSGDTFFFCLENQESGSVSGDLEKIHKTLLPKAEEYQKEKAAKNNNNTNDDDNLEQQQSSGSMMGSQQNTSGCYAGEESYGGGWGREDSYDVYGGGSNELDSALQHDIKYCESFGIKVSYEKIALGNRISVPIDISDLINQNTALAWGVSIKTPLVLQLRFERPEYTKCSRGPEVLIFQEGKSCRFGQQVKNFVAMYLHDRWNVNTGFVPPARIKISTEEETEKAQQDAILLLSAKQRLIYEALQRLGYDDAIAAAAAHQSSTKEEAIKMCEDGTVLAEDTTVGTTEGWLKQLKQQHGAAAADPNKYSVFDPDEGFLMHLVKYIRHRIPTSFRYCTICDKKHLIGAGMLKPSVCERQLCTYAFQQLNVGRDATDSVATGGGVIDLLVSFFRTACLHSRHDFVLNPYPCVSDASGKLIFDPKKKDFSKLQAVTKQLPETKDFIGIDNLGQLAAKLNGKDPACLPLLEWIISSNRSLIIKLHQSQRLTRMVTPHQFLLVTASEEKQKKFEARKKAKNSAFYFHGTRIENAHSISRLGVKVMSGTSGQLNGSAHGSGIYAASECSTALGYSNAAGVSGGNKAKGDSTTDNKYFDGSKEGEYAVMYLLEIVCDAVKDHGWCITCADEDAIMTRFFFVFTNAGDAAKLSGLNSQDPKFVEEVRALMASC